MTRQEHLKWCKERAITEMDYTGKPSSGIISLCSDLRKHPETNSEALIGLSMGQLLINPRMTRQQVIDYIDGFN